MRRSSVDLSRLLATLLLAAVALVGGCSNKPQDTASTQAGPLVQVNPPSQSRPAAPTPPASSTQANTPPAGTVTTAPLAPEPTPTTAPSDQPASAAAGLVKPLGTDAVRIGFLVPLSGPNATVGRALLDAAQMALFDLPDGKVILLPRDTELQGEGARAAADSVLAEGAEIIVGPLLSSQVATVAEAARARNVPVVSFSSDRSVAGNGVYIMGYTPEEQVGRVVAYAAAKGMTKFAIYVPETATGRALTAALDEAARKANGTVVQYGTYPQDAEPTNIITLARRFVGSGKPAYEALFLNDSPSRLRLLSQMLAYFDTENSKIKLLGTGQWEDPAILGEPLLIGGWFAAPSPQSAVQFTDRFQQAYGRRPPRVSALGYDAVSLAVALAGENKANAFTAQNLTDPNGFAGFGGIFRFRADGVAEHGLAILEVEARGFKLADPAPDTFQSATN